MTTTQEAMTTTQKAMTTKRSLAIVGQEARRPRTAVLLMNIGTPDAPTTTAVRRYLREFLSDPRVLDMNAIGRALLLHLIILPFRPSKSAAAYQTVWTSEGSPLAVHSHGLCRAVQPLLPDAQVLVAMRYGNPSLRAAVEEIARRGIERVVLVPLFPQYASASTGSALAEAYRLLGRLPVVPSVSVVPPFFDDEGFIEGVATSVQKTTATTPVEHIVFSYHGLPVHQVQATATAGHRCGGDDESRCCEQLHERNASCYRAQCVATTRALAARLGLAPGSFSTTFQSRLGRARWLLPATEEGLVALARQGKKRLAVVCPSFVADCLETVEEIAVRARELFLAHGGETLVTVPCLNADERWAAVVAGYVRRAAGDIEETSILSATPAASAAPSSTSVCPEVTHDASA
jgi:ferrochelatase